MRSSALDPATEALVRVSAAVGTRERERVAAALRHAAGCADPAAVEEVLLQAHLFVGFPDALEAMIAWRELVPRASEVAGEPEARGWRARGARVCARVYGRNYEKLRRNVPALHPALDRWMVEHGYGRVLGRPALGLATRELCVAALLATWGAPRQLHSHLRGARNAGASAAQVEAAVELACGSLDAAAAAAVRELWERVRGPAGLAG